MREHPPGTCRPQEQAYGRPTEVYPRPRRQRLPGILPRHHPTVRAADRRPTFGETLHSLALEDNLILHIPGQPDREYARRHLAGAAADLRHVLEALRDLVESPDDIDGARAEVAAHDARAVLERVAAKLEGTFGAES